MALGFLGGKRRKAKVLRASGQRLDLSNRKAVASLARARQGQRWQQDAFSYRRLIGELRFATAFKAKAVARVRYYPAQILDDEDEPVSLTSDNATVGEALAQAAQEELDRLPLDAGYRFVGVISENLSSYTGEVWLHGYVDPESSEEVWEPLSVSEVTLTQDGVVSIQRAGEPAAYRVPPTEEMLRFWVPDPEHPQLADSPMRALLDVCEGILLDGQELRTASRSRVAANGILLVPDTMQMPKTTTNDGDDGDEQPFQAELAAALSASVGNERDVTAVAPIVIQGDIEDIEAVRHIRLEREDSPEVVARVVQGLARLAQGLEIPPELMTGVGDANHWSAWLIDASTYRYFLSSDMRTFADSLTEGFLRPALRARGFSAAEVAEIQVWWDAGVLTENPNRGADALNAYDRAAIGPEALRQALGFQASDAPDEDELLQMIALKTGVDQTTSALLLRIVLGMSEISPAAPRVIEGQSTPAALPAGQSTPQGAPPDDGTPNTQPPGITAGANLVTALLAAATQKDDEPEIEWRVDQDAARDLMEIDRVLRERLVTALDAAMMRALEKAGARIRTKAGRNAAVRSRLSNFAAVDLAAQLGREGVLALGPDEKGLLDGAFDALAEKFEQWTKAAIHRTGLVVLRMLGLKPTEPGGATILERFTRSLTGRIPRAYAELRDEMMTLADRRLYHPHPDAEPGELSGHAVPISLVRDALSEIGGVGGTPGGVGGLATGSGVADTLREAGGAELGFQWAYGISVNHYPWHLALDGERFASHRDERLSTEGTGQEWVGDYFTPGDHAGCHCDAVKVWAVPGREQVLQNLLLPESESARNSRVLAEGDDRAGRKGTTAQKSRDERERMLSLQRRFLGGS